MKIAVSELRAAILAVLALAVLCGGLYPLIVFVFAQTVFHDRANGSLVVGADRLVRGSSLIGQGFQSAGYFHSRPSAAGAGYDAASSGGRNWGPTSRKLNDAIRGAVALYRSENGLAEAQPIPADAVTASGSGLDPHISPENAALQIPRIAQARGWSEDGIRKLVDFFTDPPQFGLLGEPRVNVLLLNLALDDGTARRR